ncbi:Mitogen-activated protein kinase kinase kinase 2 [Nymphaea thermarum]|nr:Mitogen-activated protein kinase kinase kinase 2 [Nymphaea thermarum]
MQEIFGSIRRSLVFPTASIAADDDGGLMRGIRNCVRRSDFLAVKQVLIAANNVSKEKAQAHIRELEEEVKLLKNLSHKNIVRYLGTAREDEALNILMEFVPGGSISSLLGKFGSFPEPVIRMYTKQLLQGLEYLHRKGVIHRDIKGANILVDNKGCIKLADFGASKQVVELATISGAKSMKGTPYWMAPEVILQTGHGLPAPPPPPTLAAPSSHSMPAADDGPCSDKSKIPREYMASMQPCSAAATRPKSWVDRGLKSLIFAQAKAKDYKISKVHLEARRPVPFLLESSLLVAFGIAIAAVVLHRHRLLSVSVTEPPSVHRPFTAPPLPSPFSFVRNSEQLM